jgi:hypothetical protein
VSCPTREELDALLAPGVPSDPIRASAVLAHTRECERCRELLRSDAAEAARPRSSSDKRRYRPNLTLVALAVTGLALVTLSRACGRIPRAGVAPVSSSSR